MFPETVPDNPFLDPGIPSINEPPDRRSPHAELELANDRLELDNDRLLTENSRLRERLEEGNAKRRAIPDWAIDELTSNFSLMGLLLARLQSRMRNQPLLRDELRGALFQVKKIGFVQAVPITRNGRKEVVVFCVMKDEALILYDIATMFPSDTLVQEIGKLADHGRG